MTSFFWLIFFGSYLIGFPLSIWYHIANHDYQTGDAFGGSIFWPIMFPIAALIRIAKKKQKSNNEKRRKFSRVDMVADHDHNYQIDGFKHKLKLNGPEMLAAMDWAYNKQNFDKDFNKMVKK